MQSPEAKAARLTAARFWIERDARYQLERAVGMPAPDISVAGDGTILCGRRRISSHRAIPIYLLTGIILERVGSPEVQEAFTKRALDGYPRQTEQVLGVADLHWDDLMADYRSCLQRYGIAPAGSTAIAGVI
jgi:hypothetical protein